VCCCLIAIHNWHVQVHQYQTVPDIAARFVEIFRVYGDCLLPIECLIYLYSEMVR
jgi:hypothetical protein